ncbi:hypothetical protein Bca52824_002360 [Brassica carinata]|uniref:Uncharacterized protein n=1 Tax=Brassica carinata TaxID=52824 RepID=A0A8X8BDT4_BRACI|nr:hypothetical protein Bca52824_002360 [Brassica carinata]
MLAQGWVSANQQYLMDVCTDEEIGLLPKNDVSEARAPHALCAASTEGTQSSTDSSAAPLNAVVPIDQRGVIRLDEGDLPLLSITKRVSIWNIGEGQGKSLDDGVYGDKPDRPRLVKAVGATNPNFPEPDPYDDYSDEG